MISVTFLSIYAGVGAAAWCLVLFAAFVLQELAEYYDE